ncbi:iron ABC transporter ATP-binding protein [Rhodoplanes elegans]|uniref:Iron ABC transporter ATP-binding protein n=1 Tax=Rhodoplanes elegans TaxID=29408 RepID=A0A327KKX2_9BRAD|nr:ABC transporter ATP-binding protein [Rhodoplanes elegans]MBK5959452.1 iron ABC transporter ATP-binding protein [Rhodoplanes elegans]RAI39500.1 iron ABC transporter ATP-binding protein [Rhodoplanes elegans]
MIRVERAGHGFRPEHWLFRDLSFAVGEGEVTAILGPNGCGKTTLLRAMGGTLALREGRIAIDGVVGVVPQALRADVAYRVIDMVLLGRSRYLGRFGAPGRRDLARAEACLDAVGLADLAARRYDRLSGGQRQLVLFARALASDCRVLLLDEPASALDLANQGVVLRLIRRLARDGMTIVFTTHHPDHALAVADTVLMMAGAPVFGPASETLDETNLARLYGVPVRRVTITSDGETIEATVPVHRLGDVPTRLAVR